MTDIPGKQYSFATNQMCLPESQKPSDLSASGGFWSAVQGLHLIYRRNTGLDCFETSDRVRQMELVMLVCRSLQTVSMLEILVSTGRFFVSSRRRKTPLLFFD